MKIGALVFAVSTLCAAQCTKTSLTHQTPNVVGDWVSAVIKMSRKGKHTLHLDANGSFNERFADPGQPDHTASGIYTITIEDLPSERDNSTEKTGIVNLFY
jgi:hypothetical protein